LAILELIKYFFLAINRTNRTNPNRIGLVWFGLDDFLKINRTKPYCMFFLSRGLDVFYAQNRIKPHREYPYLIPSRNIWIYRTFHSSFNKSWMHGIYV